VLSLDLHTVDLPHNLLKTFSTKLTLFFITSLPSFCLCTFDHFSWYQTVRQGAKLVGYFLNAGFIVPTSPDAIRCHSRYYVRFNLILPSQVCFKHLITELTFWRLLLPILHNLYFFPSLNSSAHLLTNTGIRSHKPKTAWQHRSVYTAVNFVVGNRSYALWARLEGKNARLFLKCALRQKKSLWFVCAVLSWWSRFLWWAICRQ